MGILARLLGLSEGDAGARHQGGNVAPRPAPQGMQSADGHRWTDEPPPEDDPLALANVEAAMAGRESAAGRAARQKIMAALDDEQQCKQLVGAVRRIMRQGGDA